MANYKGSDLLLKIDTASSGGPTFTAVAGIQSKDLSISREAVDVTNQDSASKHRELLAGAGIVKMNVSGRGVAAAGAGIIAARASLMDGTIKQWQVIVPGEGTYQGLFQLTQLDWGGDHSKEVTYSIRLESAGEITFTAA